MDRSLKPKDLFRKIVSILLSGNYLCILKINTFLTFFFKIGNSFIGLTNFFLFIFRNHPSLDALPSVPTNKTPKKSSPLDNDENGSKSALKGIFEHSFFSCVKSRY